MTLKPLLSQKLRAPSFAVCLDEERDINLLKAILMQLRKMFLHMQEDRRDDLRLAGLRFRSALLVLGLVRIAQDGIPVFRAE